MFTDERHFVTIALANVSALIERDYSAGDSELTSVQALLDAVIEAATPVRARGVIMAAKACLSVYENMPQSAEPSDLYSHSVMTLDRLVNQYANGLYEIDPEFAPRSQSHSQTDLQDLSASEPQADLEWGEAARQASASLRALLPMAHDHDKPALEKLLDISQRQRNAQDGPAQAKAADAPLQTAPDVQIRVDSAPLNEPRISLETLMLPVTNALLSTAYSQDVPISVSYGLGNLDMSKSDSAIVTHALIAGGNQMISALPLKVRSAGTVQIAITAYPMGADIRLDMRVPNIDPSQPNMSASLDGQAFAALRAIDGQVSLLSAPDDARQEGAVMRFTYRQISGVKSVKPRRPAAEQNASPSFDESSLYTRMSEALA